MKFYADGSVRRPLQIASDLLFLVWILLWIKLAHVVHDATLGLATPGRRIERAGGGLAGKLRDAGSAIDNLPVIGDKARSPFDGAGRAADQLADAGTSQVEAVQHLAFWLGIAVGAIPILLLVAVYLPQRWRFVRDATAGQRFVDASADLDLFALRAMTNQPMHKIAAVSADPVRAWRDGDREVIRLLATLELKDVGLSPPVASP